MQQNSFGPWKGLRPGILRGLPFVVPPLQTSNPPYTPSFW